MVDLTKDIKHGKAGIGRRVRNKPGQHTGKPMKYEVALILATDDSKQRTMNKKWLKRSFRQE